MPGCNRADDCLPGYRCDTELSVCVTTGVTDENEGTCPPWRGGQSGPFPSTDTQGGETDTGTEVDADNDGYSVADGDCDDTDASVNPGAAEICDDKDNDCDGSVDEEDVCKVDADQDGYSPPDDCDDYNNTVHPGAQEICGDGLDNDCDGIVDEEEECKVDNDGDGYSPDEGDCNDFNFEINPGALEICDDVDNDCDGVPDEGCPPDGPDGPHCGNGVCDPGDWLYCPNECEGPDNDVDNDGYTVAEGDCDDTNYYVHPGAQEICGDGLDNDCNPATSDTCSGPSCPNGVCEAGEFQTCPQDCPFCGNGVCEPGEFCIPDCGSVCGDHICSPGENCPQDCVVDMDNDGYPPPEDCNDFDYTVHPGAQEVCDGKDNDCNPATVEDCGPLCGNGVCEVNEQNCPSDCGPFCGNGVCEAGEINTCQADCGGAIDRDDDGYTVAQGDCNDFNYYINPGASEVCDGVDNDCDSSVDEIAGCLPVCGNNLCETGEQLTCPQDCQQCGNGICEANEANTCPQDCGGEIDRDGDGYSVAEGDCNDFNYYVNPGVAEVCVNYVDDNCNGLVDENCVSCGDGVCGQGESYSNCPADCDPICGNGVKEASEQCDGNQFGGLTCQNYGKPYGELDCNTNCTIDSSGCYGTDCGNGVCEQGETQQNCPQDCGGPVCGNGQIETGEVCDGTNFGGKTCQSPYSFDAGSLTCTNNCTQISTSNCYDIGPVCGNGQIETGEVCDGGNFGGKTCQNPYGFDAGSLSCINNCTQISTSNCYDNGPVCGNGQIEAGEVCDGGNFGGKTCQNPYDFDSGSLTCTNNCTQISTANCEYDLDTSSWVAKPCENGWNCIELNSQYLDYMSVYVVGDCPPLGMYEYDGVWNPDGLIQVYDTDGDGFFELWLDDATYYYDCEISWIVPDPNPNNNWSWAQYEGACLSNPDPEGLCGPYLNCGYNQNWEYVCNVHFETPDGDPSGVIE